MAYDFAKRKKKRKSRKKPEVSGRLIWFGAGVLSGLFLAFILQLAGFGFVSGQQPSAANSPKENKQPQPGDSSPKQADTNKPDDSKTANSGEEFEFYKMLPQTELKVDAESKVAYKTRAENQQPTAYLLQAGSFAVRTDAESRRATITLLDLAARVEEARLSNGVTAYRIYVGPFTERRNMMRAREKLHSEGIETLLMEKR